MNSIFKKYNIHTFDSVTSTMDIARQMADKNCPDRTVIIADQQTCGRGRMKRNWQSDQGGLYMTWVLRPEIDISFCFGYTFSAALSIAKSLEHMFKIIAEVKWPNDVLVKGKKIAGILTETQINNSELKYLNIGMGININNISDFQSFQSTSVRKILEQQVNKSKYIELLFDELDLSFKKMNPENVVSEWKSCNCTLGKMVKVKTSNSYIEGLAIDIDNNGALIVEKNDGKVETIIYGDCFEV